MNPTSVGWRRRCARSLIRAGALGLAFGVLSITLLIVAVRWWTPATIAGPLGDGGWTDRSRSWIVATGVYPAEHHDDGTFSWTAGQASLSVPHLNRSRDHVFSMRVSAARPAGAGRPPLLTIWVDDVPAAPVQTTNHPQSLKLFVPAGSHDGVNVRLAVSDVFEPGSHDRRVLGVLIDEVSLTSRRGFLAPGLRALARTGLAVAACVAGLLACGGGRRLEWLMATGVTTALVALLLHDAAFLGPFVERLAAIAVGVGACGVLVGVARSRWPVVAGLPEWSGVVGLALAVTSVKLAIFAHPLVTVGDGIFQVHRAQFVHAGHYFFTSITPRPFFEFPYAIALYVAAWPFWPFFTSKLELLQLLRGVTLGADALVAIALYAAARRQWEQQTPALLCAMLWLFSQAPMHAVCNANLTNAFGQSVFTIGVAGLIWLAARPRSSVVTLAVTGAALSVAFLSHFSTLAVGLPLLGVAGTILVVRGRAHVRRAGVWTLVLGVGAAAVSYGVYYAQFADTYHETISRVRTIEPDGHSRPGSSIVASPTIKLSRWIRGTSDDYGLPDPVLVLGGLAGAVALARRRPREGFTLILAGWAFTWMAWTAVGIAGPVQMRVLLASAPLFVCLAAYGFAALAERSSTGTVLTVAAVGWLAAEGIRAWAMCVGVGGG